MSAVHFVAFDVLPGYGRPRVRLSGQYREFQLLTLWERVYRFDDAGVWGITAAGVHYGTVRGIDNNHRGHGHVSTCADCAKDFLSLEPNAIHCPGCEISLRPAEYPPLSPVGSDFCAVAGLGRPHRFENTEPDRCAWCRKTRADLTATR
jgi:hypothetical protein